VDEKRFQIKYCGLVEIKLRTQTEKREVEKVHFKNIAKLNCQIENLNKMFVSTVLRY
jgi:hypothetical protein